MAIHPPMPPRVVSGELITSAWGNLVADAMAATDSVLGGSTPGGTAQPGGAQVPIASITLPPGYWLVHHQVLLTGAGNWKATVRGYVNGNTWCDVSAFGLWDGSDANATAVSFVAADVPAGGTVSFNLFARGGFPVSCYADSTNHRLNAMQGRSPS